MTTKQKSKLFYSGFCELCGEVYEANSGTDDLTGLKFNCKHLLCRGKVVLQKGQSIPMTNAAKREAQAPRRFC